MELETPGPPPPPGASGSQRVPILGSIPRFKITLPYCRNQLYVTSQRVNLGSEVPPPIFFF